MTDRELMQQALEALGLWASGRDMDAVALNDLIHRLEAALAEPVQEPEVKWDSSAPLVVHPHPAFQASQPQRQWQGLTDEEVKDIVWNLPYEPSPEHIRAIEAKLKEKNHG